MDPIRRLEKPELRRPRALIAFEGWNDASDAASGAVAFLLGQYDVEPFAVLDPEDFFNFQLTRPLVEVADGGNRRLTWPATRFYALPLPDKDHDVILVLGDEPHLRWQTFSRILISTLADAGVEEVVLLGAFIGQVAHTVPVPIVGVATDPAIVGELGLMTSSYEGPTGIVGVCMEACREEGIPAVSLWAAVPHYLSANPNPKAMLALLDRAAHILDMPVDATELASVAGEFEARVDSAMRQSEDLSSYVARLEEEGLDREAPTAEDAGKLISEVEQFLRDHRG